MLQKIPIETVESVQAPWLQKETDTDTWYKRFMSYYLPLGPGRTLTQAYIRYLEEEKPEKAIEKHSQGHYINVQSGWSDAARKYDWRLRAEAFDQFTAIAHRQAIQKARAKLVESTEDAAKALVEALKSPKLKVAAAKEILDRAGLPGAHVVGHSNLRPYTADDFNKAQAEVEDWENKIRGENIIEGDVRDSDSEEESERISDA